MPDSFTVADTRQGSSLVASLPDAEHLLAARADIARQLAPLRAKYAGNGYAGERLLKLDEARIATAVRAKLLSDGVKVTEPQVDAGTRTHAHYIAALEADVQERTKYYELEEQLQTLDWRLRVRASDSSLMAAEARL